MTGIFPAQHEPIHKAEGKGTFIDVKFMPIRSPMDGNGSVLSACSPVRQATR